MRAVITRVGSLALVLGMATVLIGSGAIDAAQFLPVGNQTPAPPASCDSVITGFSSVVQLCREINNNWACYGAFVSNGAPKEGESERFRFFAPKDRQPIERFDTISTAKDRDKVGAALLRLRVTDEENPITAILYGDVKLMPQAEGVSGVFTMRNSGSNYVCEETPPGLMVRTETGQSGRLIVNNVEIVLSSTAFVTMLPGEKMVVVNMEGKVTLSIPALGVTLDLPLGQQVTISERGGIPIAVDPPTPSPFFDSTLLLWLAKTGLPQIRDPNTEKVLAIPACGRKIEFGQTFIQADSVPGQECLFTFCANAGDIVTISMDAAGGALNPYIDLRAPDHSLILWNDDISATNRNSLICNLGLAETSCGYTIVARAHSNDSRGSFKLTLQELTDCELPDPRCNVTAPFGLNLRTGPGIEYASIRSLPLGAALQPMRWSLDFTWIEAQVTDTGEHGWVNANYLYCDTVAIQTSALIVPVTSSLAPEQPKSREKPKLKPPSKLSPFPGP